MGPFLVHKLWVPDPPPFSNVSPSVDTTLPALALRVTCQAQAGNQNYCRLFTVGKALGNICASQTHKAHCIVRAIWLSTKEASHMYLYPDPIFCLPPKPWQLEPPDFMLQP